MREKFTNKQIVTMFIVALICGTVITCILGGIRLGMHR